MSTLTDSRPGAASPPLGAADYPNGRPRVLIVTENQSVPSDRRVWAIATTLRRAGCAVIVICPQGNERDRSPHKLRDGIELRRFRPSPSHGSALGYAAEYALACGRIWREVRRVCAERPVDVVHACNPPDVLLAAAWPARRVGARAVFDHHDLTPELLEARFGGKLRALRRLALLAERSAFAAADVAIATNASYAEVARTRGRKRAEDVFVVRNGPDLKEFLPVAPDPALKRGKPLLIGYVGAMAPQNGVDHAVRALALLRERRDDWHAILAGDGDSRAALQRFAAELGLADAVEFTGWLEPEQVRRLLASTDVCLAPEPLTPLNDRSTMIKIGEYLAMSRPVVSYDLRESRRTAGDAALYATPNETGAFAGRINELLDDPERRTRMGRAGRARVERELAWEHSERPLLRAYRRALSARGR